MRKRGRESERVRAREGERGVRENRKMKRQGAGEQHEVNNNNNNNTNTNIQLNLQHLFYFCAVGVGQQENDVVRLGYNSGPSKKKQRNWLRQAGCRASREISNQREQLPCTTLHCTGKTGRHGMAYATLIHSYNIKTAPIDQT